MIATPPAPVQRPDRIIKAETLLRLQRFRARLRRILSRPHEAPPPDDVPPADDPLARAHMARPTHPHAHPHSLEGAASVDDGVVFGRTVDAADAPDDHDVADVPDAPVARRFRARTIEGNARSADGMTAPWLMLPAERNYRLYIPEHVRNGHSLPLTVMIHGCRESAAEFEQGTRMNALADAHGFAVLYPDQATFANIRRCWNWFEPNTAAGHGECAIVLAMIAEARRHAKIDLERICVAGMSSGGALAALLAFHHPDVFAAAAVHSGLPPMMPPSAAAAISAMEKGVRVDNEAMSDSYWNTHEVLPPPLLVIHGNNDERVTERNATALVKLWEKLYESAPGAEQLQRDDREYASTPDARAYTRIDLKRDDRIVVRGVRVHGLAHAWSGGDEALPFNDARGPEASALIWRFFERQRRVAMDQ